MDKLNGHEVLIKQLNAVKNMVKSENPSIGKTVIDMAISVLEDSATAKENERLRAENERLKAENEKLKATNSKLNVQISNLFESLKDAT